VVKERKEFVDSLQLRLADSDFEKYLQLFSYPSRLRNFLLKRKLQLEERKKELALRMDDEKADIVRQIA